jgi:hypothetical protein
MIHPLDFRSPGFPAQPTRWDLAAVPRRPGDLFPDGFGGIGIKGEQIYLLS